MFGWLSVSPKSCRCCCPGSHYTLLSCQMTSSPRLPLFTQSVPGLHGTWPTPALGKKYAAALYALTGKELSPMIFSDDRNDIRSLIQSFLILITKSGPIRLRNDCLSGEYLSRIYFWQKFVGNGAPKHRYLDGSNNQMLLRLCWKWAWAKVWKFNTVDFATTDGKSFTWLCRFIDHWPQSTIVHWPSRLH